MPRPGQPLAQRQPEHEHYCHMSGSQWLIHVDRGLLPVNYY